MADIAKIDTIEIANIAKVASVDIANIASIYGASFVSGFYSKTIDNSCRFNDGDSAYLHKTPGGAGNVNEWIFSTWMKLGSDSVGTNVGLMSVYQDAINRTKLQLINAGNNLGIYSRIGAGVGADVEWPSQLLRDPGSWYHILFSMDTSQVAAVDGIRLWVNGVENTNQTVYTWTQSRATMFGTTTRHDIGAREAAPSFFFDGYLAETVYLDGVSIQQGDHTITDFGEFKSGVWIPKDVSGLTYGTNGFHMDFDDSANLGNDANGGTDLTEVNLVASDQVSDSPTNNWCTLNPLNKTTLTYSEGNLKIINSDGGTGKGIGTFGINSGKWYWETYLNDRVSGGNLPALGIVQQGTNLASYVGVDLYEWGLQCGNDPVLEGDIYSNGSEQIASLTTFADGDKIMFALDMDTGKFFVGKNGAWLNSGDPVAGTGGVATGLSDTWYPAGSVDNTVTVHYNFGQDSTNVLTGNADSNGYGDFEYAPPTGFLALCSANLSDPAVEEPSTAFKAVTYTGNATDDTDITVGFQPNMTVIKNRSQTDEYKVVDSVRGATKELNWDSTNAESTDATGLKAFISNGFTLGTGAAGYNDSGENFISWNWLEGSTYGLDTVEYTGTGSSDTVAHGLGAVPHFIVVKEKGGADNWYVYHHKMDSTAPEDYYLQIDSPNAAQNSAYPWDDTAPTSSVFSVQNFGTNISSDTYIAYVWTSIEGFSKFGSYEGNSNDDGPFVHCGFRPAFVITKQVGASNNWLAMDSARSTYNVVDWRLKPEQFSVDANDWRTIDMLSNGFKVRWSNAEINASGTFIYMAWAEAPFKYANAR